MIEEDILEYCNNKIYEYSGTGELLFEDGQKFDCEFVAFQMKNGKILFHAKRCRSKIQQYSSPKKGYCRASFVGVTDKKYKISGENGLIIHIESVNDERSITCSFEILNVQILENENKREVHFGITNFEFTGNECNERILTLNLKESARISIQKLQAYKKIMRWIKTFRSIDVTCEAIFNLSEEKFENTIEILDNLLYAMSIARGTKIQWIYYEIFDDKEICISRVHSSSRVTKVYSSYNLIDPKDTNSTKIFLENAKPIFGEKNKLVEPMRELIDSHLDSLIPGVYLETKGANLGITMEMLKESFIRTAEKDGINKENILTEEKFKELEKSIKKCIKFEVKEKEKRALMYKNLKSINRRPFNTLISDFCKEINFEVNEDQVQLFVKCRNKLVHTGNFYCRYATEDKERYPQLKDELSEYRFLVDFINKLLLKSYGYKGFYLDWSSTEGPVCKELV
ncbi:hypothetical protein MSBRW_3514 [Methanosarcina barkeri str. Wiesmoor]|uniref:ApeA N-terminal domain-containing protein n=2 Tax=Methanosarcina barkeri TaxID=2208 RepID=A0A0E3QR42_METBA|nr:hypothetical protein [Methanosarcina barkeri]AKB52767.1 hypothetical protein MSBRW_3514 [Methanosarcina barkeri str. Wiesmoor]